jgi:hypothetical protein
MKWVEPKALTNNITVVIFWFIYEHIITKFDCPLELINDQRCNNPNFGFAIKAKVCEGASQKWNPRITFHVLMSVGECEGMTLHTPKWTCTLGVGVPMDSQIF